MQAITWVTRICNFSSRNNKLRLKINWIQFIRKSCFESYISFYYLESKMFKVFKILIILIILIRIQDVQESSLLDYLDSIDRPFLSNYLVKSDVRWIVLIITRLVTNSFYFYCYYRNLYKALLILSFNIDNFNNNVTFKVELLIFVVLTLTLRVVVLIV